MTNYGIEEKILPQLEINFYVQQGAEMPYKAQMTNLIPKDHTGTVEERTLEHKSYDGLVANVLWLANQRVQNQEMSMPTYGGGISKEQKGLTNLIFEEKLYDN